MNRIEFQTVVDRLKLILGCQTETAVGERLGFTQSTWASRKMRGSLPRKEIDALIKAEQLNPEFIYKGIGDVHITFDGKPWETGYAERAKVFIGELGKGFLADRGHHEGLIEAISKPVLGSGPYQVLTALRDLVVMFDIDINALLTGHAPKVAAASAELPADEQALLAAYRKASEAEREMLRRVAGMKPAKVK